MSSNPRVLILDDDPLHLDLYATLVRRAGFDSIPVLVRFSGPDPIPNSGIDVILLDYRLNSVKTAPELAQEVRSKYPQAPLIVMSDLWSAPPDIVPYITSFVRKGDPETLLEVLSSYHSSDEDRSR